MLTNNFAHLKRIFQLVWGGEEEETEKKRKKKTDDVIAFICDCVIFFDFVHYFVLIPISTSNWIIGFDSSILYSVDGYF